MSRFYTLLEQEKALPLYLVGVGRERPQNFIERPNGLGAFQLLYGRSGLGRLRCGGRTFAVPPGAAFLMAPENPHSYGGDAGGWETGWVTFDGDGARKILSALGFSDGSPFWVSDPSFLETLLNDLLRGVRGGGPFAGQRNSARLYAGLVELSARREKEPHAAAHPATQLQPAIRLIDRRFAEPLTLDALAAAAGVTPQYVCRLFRRVTGSRPSVYLTLRRIQEAKRLLVETALPVSDVACRVGFSGGNYFCAVFRRNVGISPGEFRRRNRGR